jgi:catechol-2,3-dioxygenase
MHAPFDRATGNVGNIVKFEHVNIRVIDQGPATLFYLAGLGLTRDPYVNVSTNLMWVNVGRQQFHLPTGVPQVIRGWIGLVLPNRDELLKRLSMVGKQLKDTKFLVREQDTFVEVHCPWGNRLRCHTPDRETFGPYQLAVPYVEFDVPVGTAAGIARFYREIMGAPATLQETNEGVATRVTIGEQWLLFRETDAPLPEYDNHHIQIYIADFAGPYAKMQERGLISMETNAHEYRFVDMIDPEDGRFLYKLEHEVRSLLHPGYGREFVNRNPAQSGQNYMAGKDALSWALP